MIRAIIDAPWIAESGTWKPDYAGDYVDVTGEDWYTWNGEQRKGGNYPPGAGLDPAVYPQNAWLQIRITVEDEAALAALDADDRYHVYWSEEIVETPDD